MSDRLTPEARNAVFISYAIARTSISQKIETEHLLIGITHENAGFLNRFLKTKVTGDAFRDAIEQNLAGSEESPKSASRPQRTEEYERVMALAAQEADQAGQENIGIDHLLIAMLREENSTAAKMLRERGADIDLVRFQLAAEPHNLPSEKERKLRALNRVANLLENALPSESARIAAIKNRFEDSDGEDASDLADEMMEMMASKAGKVPANNVGSPNLITEKMRRLVFFAQFEAKRSGSSEVKPEHLLLVILREQKKHLSLFMPLADSKETVRTEIEQTLRPTENTPQVEELTSSTRPPLSEECKRVQIYAREEAEKLWSPRIGSEHLLLGILREKDSLAASIMRKYGADLENIREGLAALPSATATNPNETLQ